MHNIRTQALLRQPKREMHGDEEVTAPCFTLRRHKSYIGYEMMEKKSRRAHCVCVCVHGNNFAPPFAYIIKKLLLSDKNTHSLALTHSLTQAAVVAQ
jgi:hypothetical protein